MKKITVDTGIEKRCLYSEIIDLQKQGIISQVECKKALYYISNLKNKNDNIVPEFNFYDEREYYDVDNKEIERKAINVIIQIS